MTVYVDDMKQKTIINNLSAEWSHLFTIPVCEQELDNFAILIGLKIKWKQKSGSLDVHYDVTEKKRQLAIQKGAIPITALEGARLRLIYKRRYAALGNQP